MDGDSIVAVRNNLEMRQVHFSDSVAEFPSDSLFGENLAGVVEKLVVESMIQRVETIWTFY